MPLADISGYGRQMGSMLERYLPDTDRNVFGGKLTLRKVWDALVGSRAEDQIAGFAQPMAMGMYVKPKWGEVGSFSGLWDKKPRVEISDESAKLIQRNPGVHKLKDVLKHDVLYEREPDLQDLMVLSNSNMSSPGHYDRDLERIVINPDRPDLLGNLMHEIQHRIQHKSGWARGGSPEEFTKQIETAIDPKILGEASQLLSLSEKYNIPIDDVMKHPPVYLKDISKESIFLAKKGREVVGKEMDFYQKVSDPNYPFNEYRKIAGEAEARDTTNRLLMNTEQRRKRMPLASQGIALKDMIVRY